MTELTQDYVKRIFDYDPQTGILTRKVQTSNRIKVGVPAGHMTNKGYLVLSIFERKYLVHRIIWLYVYGIMPKNYIDHINMNKLDNRISNLRVATKSENGANQKRRKNNTSGYKGVSWYKRIKKWKSAIMVDGKNIGLGYFSTPERAALAYDIAARKYFGKFACVNFPLCHESAA